MAGWEVCEVNVQDVARRWTTEGCVILLSQLQSASHVIRLGGGGGGVKGDGGGMGDAEGGYNKRAEKLLLK